ncbi:MAG: glutathione S-transferase N-terminal domain-containing protein [Polyangiaceae bacterium]
MELFFSPGASSLAPHAALREAGIPFELVRVDLDNGKVAATGQSFGDVHRMAKVPALRLPDGTVLSETLALLHYIAELAPAARLMPEAGTMARARALEVMSFVATELHKGFSPFLDPETPASFKQHLLEDARPFEQLVALLEPGPYVLGGTFSVADLHLFIVLRMGRAAGLDFSRWPAVERFVQRIGARASVVEALRAEGVVEG